MISSAIKNPALLVVAVLVLGLLGGVLYLNSRHRDEPAESSGGAAIPVRIAQVRRVSLPSTVRLTGELRPITRTDVVSRLAGHVTEVRYKAGNYVPPGALVATVRAGGLDQRVGEIETSIGAAKHALREREAESAEAEKHLAKDRDLIAQDLIARRDGAQSEIAAETARARVELARAHLAQREAMLAQVRALQGLTRLTAPVGGEVDSISVKAGGSVAAGGAVLSIVSLDTLKLVAKVRPGAALRRGMRARISAATLPDIAAEGQVARFDAEKEGEETLEAEIHVDNRKGIFRPGIAAEAWVELETAQELLLIPQSAIISEDASHYVYMVSGGQAVRREVRLGMRRGEEVAIAQGLTPGDAIIIDGRMIKSGMRVRPAGESDRVERY